MNAKSTETKAVATTNEASPKCGIVMPISAIDDCPESHWSDVRAILDDAIEAAGFEPNLVSDADDIGVIQKRIVQNLYDNPIVVCDISCKNPNVMFELGLRLAFDKPTICIKDHDTSFSFDTSPIEHLLYPRDLRFSQIVDFKEKLSDKIKATHAAATKDPKNYTTFLKHFGTFTVAKLDSKEISGSELLLEELKQLKSLVRHRSPSHSERGEQEVIEYFSAIMKGAAQNLGITRKADARKSKDKMRKQAFREIPGDWRRAMQENFDSLFDLMYGQ